MNKNILVKNIKMLEDIDKRRVEVLFELIKHGKGMNNYPIAEKYANELVKMNENNIDFLLIRSEVNVFIKPENTKKDLEKIKDIIPNLNLKENILNILKSKIKLLNLKYNFSIGNYNKAINFLDKNIPESVIFYEFSRCLLKDDKISFEKYNGYNKKDFNFYMNIISKLDFFKMKKQFKEWYYVGKVNFKEKKYNKFLNKIESNILLSENKFEKVKNILRENKDDQEFVEVEKCLALVNGDYKKYWDIRKKQESTIVNILSTYNIAKYKDNNILKKKKIIITMSEGFGDNIMSYRYLIKFIEDNPDTKITLLSFKELKTLFTNLLEKYDIKILEYLNQKDHEELIKDQNDYFIYLTELAGELNINTKEDVKFLDKFNYKNSNMKKKSNNKILINWKTSNRNIDTLQRSFKLEDFLNKINIEEITSQLTTKEIITVQFDITDEEKELLNKYNIKILEVKDFKETFDILKNCSDVYTNDTAIMHLSGFLGIKTNMYLSKYIDCKFLDKEENKEHYLYDKLTVI